MGIGVFKSVRRPAHRFLKQGKFLLAESAEDMVMEGAFRLSDSNADSGDCLCSHMDENGFQSIVPASAAGLTKSQHAKWERGVIEDDHDLSSRNFVISRKLAHCFAAEVHEGLWLHEGASASARSVGIPLLVEGECGGSPPCQLVANHEPNIVAGVLVLSARISETGYEPVCSG